MTLLKNLMQDRADALEAPMLDLDAIAHEGQRRIHRRRVGVSALAASAVVAAVALPVGLGAFRDDAQKDELPVAVSETRPLTWSTGSTIHADGDVVDVGHEVFLFVEVADGYVFADPQRRVWHWDGAVARQVGQLGTEYDRELVSDGRWAAWVDETRGDLRFATLDTATATVSHVEARQPADPGEFGGAAVGALDGATLYARDARGALTVADGTVKTLVAAADLPPYFRFEDVEDGQILFSVDLDTPDGGASTYLSEDIARPGEPLGVWKGDLSPDGQYVMSENSADSSDDFTVIDLESGKEVSPDWQKDYEFFLGYAWVDADSYSAFGLRTIPEGGERNSMDDLTFELLRCDVGAECTVESDLTWPLQFPIGEHISD